MKLIWGIAVIVFFIYACRESIIEPEEANIRTSNGKIFVNSSPSGARIFWNNWNMQRFTPDSLTKVFTGIHEIRLVREGYRDTTVIVYMQEYDIEYVNVALTSLSVNMKE